MFKKIDRKELSTDPFTIIGDDWTLISAKNNEAVNTMTASWAQLGHLWNSDVMTIYLRQHRYTKEFVDETKKFSVSFFKEHKKELTYLGRNSGRDKNKIADVDFHVVNVDGYPTFEEAYMTFTCEVLYIDDIKKECFLNDDIPSSAYSDNDYHTMYIAKITGIYVNE